MTVIKDHKVDFLIIGQGIAGTLLSFELMKSGKKVLVIDKPDPLKASLVAGAVLNPMAGKHWSPSADASLFLPKAKAVYRELEELLDISILQEMSLHVFHETKEKQMHFEQQEQLHQQYLSVINNNSSYYFNVPHGQGLIKNISVVDADTLLSAFQQYLRSADSFQEDHFDEQLIEFRDNSIFYKDIKASEIIYCNGVQASESRFFNRLPFTQNRGDVLILEIPELPQNAAYHHKLRLIPKGNHQFWCGSNYQWKFDDLLPDEKWRTEAEQMLENWLKVPFEVVKHIVARRPTTAGQIPFLGRHPDYRNVSIFNGLGTRGFSSGPYWAAEMARHLISPDYPIKRYDVDFKKWL